MEGFTFSLEKMFPTLPTIDYSCIRRRIIRLGDDIGKYKRLKRSPEPIVIVLDSTGGKSEKVWFMA